MLAIFGNMELRLANSLKSLAIFGVFPNIITGAGTNDRIGGVDTWMANMSDFLTKVVSNCTIVTSADVSTHV